MNLVKFADVYRFWNKYRNILRSALPPLIEKYCLEEPILWTLFHTDSIFGCSIIKELGLKNNAEAKFFNSAGDARGYIRYWKGNMRQRLKSKDRSRLFIK